MHKRLSVAATGVILAALLAACHPPPPPPPPPPPQQQPTDYFQPASWRADNQADADLGSSGPVFVDAAKTQLFQIGKQHTAFLLSTSSLGGADHETPLAQLPNACPGVVDGQNAVMGSSVYIACSSGVRRIDIAPGPPPTMSVAASFNNSTAFGPVAADPAGLIWSANHNTNILYGLNPTTGAAVATLPVTFDGQEHFPTPTIVGGDVLIESGQHVVAFSTAATTGPPLWTSPLLDGIVQSRPVVVGGIVVVGTENGSLYGLNVTNGTKAWGPVSIGPAETLADVHAHGAPCGDIDPLGITSNLVVDNGTVYAVGERNAAPNPPQHVLIGVTATGATTLGPSVIDPPGSYNVAAEQQRAGLAVGNGNVYIGLGGLAGDCGDYHGFVVAASKTTGNVLGSFMVAAATKGGAVWGTSGPVLDGSGNVYASTGNDLSVPASGTDFSDAVIKLSP